MFRFRRLSPSEINGRVLAASSRPANCPRILSLETGPALPEWGMFAHDRSRSCLGHGEAIFAAAKSAFAQWRMFDLGWVRVVNAAAPIACGEIVVVEVRSLGLWSVNLSRIVATVDNETQFGFIYATTPDHIEQGEERFLLRFDPRTREVIYELEAVSWPHYFLARAGYPLTRFFQHKFARDSHRRMCQAVTLKT